MTTDKDLAANKDRHVLELVKRSGILETLAREDEEKRAAAFEGARQRKKSAVDRFLVDRPKAEARVSAAEERAQAARKAFEASVAELAKASQALDQVRGEFEIVRGEVDSELRKHADPRVDAAKKELEELRRNENGRFTRGTQEELSQAIRQISALIDEVDNRIRVAGERGDITDIGAALEELQTRIPPRSAT